MKKKRKISYKSAIYEALFEEMQRDEKVVLLGEDISVLGGAFGVTGDLWKHFSKERIINTPISENSFVGVAIGMAMLGMRPVVEIMFMDFIALACDQIINHAAKIPYIYGGQIKVPMVIRTPFGAGRGYGASHSQSLERLFMGIPGVKIVAPYSVSDAKNLLKAAIKSEDLIIFMEHKMLYPKEGEFLDNDQGVIDINKARILREGKDITLISYSKMLDYCFEVADELCSEVSIEVIDLCSLKPIDTATIMSSVKKTGRVVFVEEGPKVGGIGAEVCSQISEQCLEYLNGRVVRVGSHEVPIPSSRHLEEIVLPDKEAIAEGIKKSLSWQ